MKIKILNVIPNIKDYEPYVIYLYDNKDVVNNFIFLSYNRNIKESHVNKMYKKIKNGVSLYSDFSPIMVDIKDYAILDGQNRFKAFCKCWDEGIKAELKVLFVDIPYNRRIQFLKEINNNSQKWSIDDYAKLLEHESPTDYERITEFALKNKLCHKETKRGININWRYTFQFLFGVNKTTDFKKFNLGIKPMRVKKAQKLHDEIEIILSYLDCEMGSWFEQFVGAYYYLRDTDDFLIGFIDKYGIHKLADNLAGLNIKFDRKREYYINIFQRASII